MFALGLIYNATKASFQMVQDMDFGEACEYLFPFVFLFNFFTETLFLRRSVMNGSY